MRVKNLTPFLFGSKVTSRRPPRPEITLIVKARFTLSPGEPVAPPEGPSLLSQGTLRGDVFAEDDDDRTGECLYASDFADFKPRADVLLRATCHTPKKAPMAECPVRFGVGGWSKILRIVGDRAWKGGLLGAKATAPVPFQQMPIDARHAFGGPGYPLNTVGKGFPAEGATPSAERLSGAEGAAPSAGDELPNVEGLRDRVEARGDRPAPAGYGPLSPNHPGRKALLGKEYGPSYLEKRAPYYAEDFDWSHFNAAPLDQQIPYLRGDEELIFQNLHPDVEVFTTRLPGLRIRAFLRDAAGDLREVPMRLDTLYADLEEGHLELTFRGLDGVKEDDLSDVKTVLLASEALGEAPLPEAHYRALLERFEADPLEIEDKLPPDLRAAWKALQDSQGPAPEPGGDPVADLVDRRLVGVPETVRESLRRALAAASASPMPAGKSLPDAIGAALRKVPDAAPAAQALSTPDPRVKKLFDAVTGNVEKARRSAAARGAPIKGIEQWDKLLRDPRLAAAGLVQSKAKPGARPGEAGGAGADFSGRDLTGHDLSGRDLTGANFTGALLSKANLAGATLKGATLRQAVLFKADLRGADLEGADLGAANLQGAVAGGAIFRGCALDHANFDGAALPGATFEGAHGVQSVLSRADLTGAVFTSSVWRKTFFESANLQGADLGGADMEKCLFSKARLQGAIFTDARLTGSSFEDADLTRARFLGVQSDDGVYLRAVLSEASFACASLVRAHFTEATGLRANFFGADLREARFYRASLQDANFGRANLHDANLQKARVGGASFVLANLYDAKLLGTSGAGCDFRGANLTRCTLERLG